jgi:hypothetical protein
MAVSVAANVAVAVFEGGENRSVRFSASPAATVAGSIGGPSVTKRVASVPETARLDTVTGAEPALRSASVFVAPFGVTLRDTE